MSFKCDQCNTVQKNGVKPTRAIVETRQVTYKNDEGLVSHGWEIVREENLCSECYE